MRRPEWPYKERYKLSKLAVTVFFPCEVFWVLSQKPFRDSLFLIKR